VKLYVVYNLWTRVQIQSLVETDVKLLECVAFALLYSDFMEFNQRRRDWLYNKLHKTQEPSFRVKKVCLWEIRVGSINYPNCDNVEAERWKLADVMHWSGLVFIRNIPNCTSVFKKISILPWS
jgi:hypothetical protein